MTDSLTSTSTDFQLIFKQGSGVGNDDTDQMERHNQYANISLQERDAGFTENKTCITKEHFPPVKLAGHCNNTHFYLLTHNKPKRKD